MVNETMIISATSALDELLSGIIEENNMPFMMAGAKDDSLLIIKFSEEGKSIFNVQDALELRDSGFEGRVDPSILDAPNLSENLKSKLKKLFGHTPETEAAENGGPKISTNSPITLTKRVIGHATVDVISPMERTLFVVLMENIEELKEELVVKDTILYNSIEETLIKMLEALDNRGESFDGKLRKFLVKQLIGLDLLRLTLLLG